jgi:hypothetical protein
MVKIIKIEKCWKCPYCELRFLKESYRIANFCTADEDNQREVVDPYGKIPDWCPLQEESK